MKSKSIERAKMKDRNASKKKRKERKTTHQHSESMRVKGEMKMVTNKRRAAVQSQA